MDFDFSDAEVEAMLAEVSERITAEVNAESARLLRKVHRAALRELEIQGTVDPENLDPSRRAGWRENIGRLAVISVMSTPAVMKCIQWSAQGKGRLTGALTAEEALSELGQLLGLIKAE